MLSAEELVKGYQDRVYNLALRLTGNRSDAWDLTQESLLRAVRALPEFRGDSDPGTWLFRITVNAWKSRVSSRTWRWWSRLASIDGFVGPSPEPGPEAQLERGERARAVDAALAGLEPEERAILMLRELEEKSYAEIADILGLAP
jgi:RNA polymerase sigma-70 factor, ECF subfamily